MALKHFLVLILLATPLGCEKTENGTDVVGASAGRGVADSNAQQRIKLATDLISIGKLADAEQMLKELSAPGQTLSASTQEKLREAYKQLDAAKTK